MWGCTGPRSNDLRSPFPPSTARGIPNLLGAAFAFAVAPASHEQLDPPRGEWRWAGDLRRAEPRRVRRVHHAVPGMAECTAGLVTCTLPLWRRKMATKNRVMMGGCRVRHALYPSWPGTPGHDGLASTLLARTQAPSGSARTMMARPARSPALPPLRVDCARATDRPQRLQRGRGRGRSSPCRPRYAPTC